MCFAFTTTEQQLTARSYPEHDITPPARTLRKQRAAARRGGHGKTFVEYDVRLSMSLRYLAGGS